MSSGYPGTAGPHPATPRDAARPDRARLGRPQARSGRSDATKATGAVWPDLNRPLANLIKQGIDQLAVLVKAGLKRMQYRPGLTDGFPAKTGLHLTLS
jgi:hypothetical protein